MNIVVRAKGLEIILFVIIIFIKIHRLIPYPQSGICVCEQHLLLLRYLGDQTLHLGAAGPSRALGTLPPGQLLNMKTKLVSCMFSMLWNYYT